MRVPARALPASLPAKVPDTPRRTLCRALTGLDDMFFYLVGNQGVALGWLVRRLRRRKGHVETASALAETCRYSPRAGRGPQNEMLVRVRRKVILVDSFPALDPAFGACRVRSRRFALSIPSLLALVALFTCASIARAVDYLRDVRPILAHNCFQCHGADDAARKAGLRLDDSSGADRPIRKRRAGDRSRQAGRERVARACCRE